MNNDLINDINSRMKTLMIGFIDRFEQSFGYLWNHGSEPQTENQKLFKQKWLDLRTTLLDYGNDQIRLAINDIKIANKSNKYKYHYKFINPNPYPPKNN